MRTLLAGLLIAAFANADSRTEAVDKVFEPFTKPGSPGCSVGVFIGGSIAYEHGYGLADLEHATPFTPSSPVYLASVSKQFTAASVMKLVEMGKLKLNDPARKYVPELPPFASAITIEHLLHHTSGLRDYFSILVLGPKIADDFHISNSEFLTLMSRQKSLNFAPGAQHLYSNSGYVLLSIVVERVSGQSLRKFAAEQIFAPLGMKDTHFHDDHTELIPNRAVGYVPRKSGGWSLDSSTLDAVGDGGLFSTIDDLFKWDQAFPEVLLTKGRLNDGTDLEYARGVVVRSRRGLDAIEHGGALNGYRTHFLRFPREKVSIAVLCNAGNANPSSYAEQIAEIYLEGKLGAKAAPPKAAELPSISAALPPGAEGSYFSDETLGTVSIFIEERKVYLRGANIEARELKPRGNGKWAAGGLEVQFREDEIVVGQPRAQGFVFRRAPRGN